MKRPYLHGWRRGVNLTGFRFGRLTVIGEAPRNTWRKYGQREWLCKCKCGNKCQARGDVLKVGNKRSCNCLLKESARQVCVNNTGHERNPTRRLVCCGLYKHGFASTEIGERLGISDGAVRYYLRKAGVPRRKTNTVIAHGYEQPSPGFLVVVGHVGKYWKVFCKACGRDKPKLVRPRDVWSLAIRSCGCLAKPPMRTYVAARRASAVAARKRERLRNNDNSLIVEELRRKQRKSSNAYKSRRRIVELVMAVSSKERKE